MNFSNTTVIVPSRNRPASVLALLAYLREELGWECRVVVVDQSDDRGARLSAHLAEAGATHLVDDARGAGAARNKGASTCATEWILFLDDDVRPSREYWRSLSDFVRRNPWADAVQGRTEQREAWRKYSADPQSWLRNTREERLYRTSFPEEWTAAERLSSAPWGNYAALTIGTGSGNLLVSRRAFFGAGGFDERIEGLGDDREFGLRMWWLGYRTSFCPDAIAFHLRESEGGLRGRGNWKRRWFGPDPSPGALYLYLKWMPGHAWREMIAWRVLKLARRPWSLPVNAFRLMRSARAARELHRRGAKHLSDPLPRAAAIQDAILQYSTNLGA
ncbi:MAG: glycosyltransferase [Acidobacteriia bacterium]|nr:glycosyltransferase [Terriglobia bacterium]